MGKKKTAHPGLHVSHQLKELRKNEKGLIVNWDSACANAQYLHTLVENGDVDGLTAGKIQKKFPQFALYLNKALTGGLKTISNSAAEDVAAARGVGSSVIKMQHSHRPAPGVARHFRTDGTAANLSAIDEDYKANFQLCESMPQIYIDNGDDENDVQTLQSQSRDQCH